MRFNFSYILRVDTYSWSKKRAKFYDV